MTKNDTTASVRREGMLMLGSSSDMISFSSISSLALFEEEAVGMGPSNGGFCMLCDVLRKLCTIIGLCFRCRIWFPRGSESPQYDVPGLFRFLSLFINPVGVVE